MTVLVIRRLDTRGDRFRDYRVLVDGKQRAQVGNDATVQIGVTPGNHTLQLAIDWCRSRELPLSFAAGEIVRVQCRPKAGSWLALLYITIWRNDYIALEMVKDWTP